MRIEPIAAPDDRLASVVSAITASDGRSPVNELGQLALDGLRDATVLAAFDGDASDEALGFAVIDHREQAVQLGVHPDHGGRGVGAALARAAMAVPDARTFWAFGDSPAAQALARDLGLTKTRELLQLSRPLGDAPDPIAPDGIILGAFTPPDDEAVVRVNARAFAHHPEQGNSTLEDFRTLTDQPWFDPEGLIVARDADGRVLGFHWTKQHSATLGEVYVLAVDPDAEGRGLGRVLLEAGLAHLARRGMSDVTLYVESSSKRVVAMYMAARFELTNTDASYVAEGN